MFRCGPDEISPKTVIVQHAPGESGLPQVFNRFHRVCFGGFAGQARAPRKSPCNHDRRQSQRDGVGSRTVPKRVVAIPRIGEQPAQNGRRENPRDKQKPLVFHREAEAERHQQKFLDPQTAAQCKRQQ